MKEFYPDMAWEFLIGGQVDVKVDEMNDYFYTSKKHLCNSHRRKENKRCNIHGIATFRSKSEIFLG